jgi:dCMP deaminase
MDKAVKYFKLASYNAELFSKDPHTKVGAIILTHDFSRILSTGINGFPRGFGDTIEKRWERPVKYNYASHAEQNSICNAARTGTPLDGSIIIITMFPCVNCTKSLIQSGIVRIYTVPPNFDDPRWGEEFKLSLEMLNEVGIDVVYVQEQL